MTSISKIEGYSSCPLAELDEGKYLAMWIAVNHDT